MLPLHEFENLLPTPHVSVMTAGPRRMGIDRLVGNGTALFDGDRVPDHCPATPR